MKKRIYQKAGAYVHDSAIIGDGVVIWHGAQIGKDAVIGKETIIGNNVYIDSGVKIGAKCKIQSGASIFRGVLIDDGVFVGPHVCFTNDKYPRAINQKTGKLKTAEDWKILKTKISKNASIGANSTILPGIIIGPNALVGAGSVVTRNVPPNAMCVGNPARVVGFMDKNGVLIKTIANTKNGKK